MICRKRLNISTFDCLYGLRQTYNPLLSSCSTLTRDIERLWSQRFGANNENLLVAMCVRSAFDVLLSTLCFNAGDEVLMSAITIKDMYRIVEVILASRRLLALRSAAPAMFVRRL